MTKYVRDINLMHIHTYKLALSEIGEFNLGFYKRFITDAAGVPKSLGLRVSPKNDKRHYSR
jgi:hypothetical protein